MSQVDGGELRFQADEAALAAATIALGRAGIGITALVAADDVARGALPRR